MTMAFGNVFGKNSRQWDSSVTPVWLEVKERKIAGGTINIAAYSKGDEIAPCAPIKLPVMGGTAVILDAFKVEADIDTSATAVKLGKGIFGTLPAAGMIVGKVGANGTATKAATLGTYTEGTGFAITAASLGALSEGDLLYICEAAGSNKAAVLPNGFSWREIYIDVDTPAYATVAVVTKGQVLEDRVPTIPAIYKAAVPGVTFEKELSE